MRPFPFHAAAVLLAVAASPWPLTARAADLPQAATPAAPGPAELEALQQALQADAPPAAQPQVARDLDLRQSLILDVALAAFSDPEPLQLGAHDPQRTGVQLQQLEWHLTGEVDPYLRFEANLVFGLFGVEIEEVYTATTALGGGVQARLGQFLAPFGRLNPTHPHAWQFVDQPLVLGKFHGGEGNRGLGLEAAWLVPVPWFAEVKVAVQGAASECCARSYYGDTDRPIRSPHDLLVTGDVRQFFPLTRDVSLLWGVSAQTGPNASGNGNRTHLFGTDLYLRWRPEDDPERRSLALQVETLVRQRQVPGDVLLDHGGYAQLVGQFALRWQAGVRSEYGSGLPRDPLDPDWTDTRLRHSVQLTFLPSHFSRLRLQASRDTPPDRTPVLAVFLAAEVLLGAHGAHAY